MSAGPIFEGCEKGTYFVENLRIGINCHVRILNVLGNICHLGAQLQASAHADRAYANVNQIRTGAGRGQGPWTLGEASQTSLNHHKTCDDTTVATTSKSVKACCLL